MENTQKSNTTVKIIVNILSLVLIAIGGYILIQRFVLTPETQPVAAVQEVPEPPKVEEVQKRTLLIDEAGIQLTRVLKQNGFNMGFVGTGFLDDLGFEIPVKVDERFRETKNELEFERLMPTPLEDIVPAPANPVIRNKIVWPEYNIDAPIIYAEFSDIFQKDTEGNFAFDQYVNNDPVDSPVQTKLKDGVVHLPFTPSPGEVGNSYIIGHSSNYSFVDSDFNLVFADIINNVSEGESFMVYDNLGRELEFKVIETKVLREQDVADAYIKFDDKRTVSLQGSILEQTPEGILPTKRYLVVAELQVPEAVTDNITSNTMIDPVIIDELAPEELLEQ